ncbi:MAG: YkgJ family cysteine cluster protein [Proteobacteria bacterium]|nr:YkgJ family cysteine cluster protein [Pseudomonadota bacterium]
MSENFVPLSLNDSFRFKCSASVPCFNECCRDLNQFLTPYDILWLKNNLGIPSNLFLESYATQHTGPESGLPIITLKPAYTSELKCPFVSTSGCTVYKDRPSSCRTYPLARVLTRSRETGQNVEQYLLIKEPHCQGFKQGQINTVREWIKEQGIEIYNNMNDLLMEIISLKNRFMPGQLSIKSERFFHMACYDLDTFRSHIFDKGILDDLALDSKTLDIIKKDDVELLKLSLKSIKIKMFGIK